MNQLEKELHRLSNIAPSRSFLRDSKSRLMHQIELQKNEGFFQSFLRKVGRPMPSDTFLKTARPRLMRRINDDLPVFRWRPVLAFAKQAVASTLVMALAVTGTLFFVEGGSVVVAGEDTYIEVLSGQVRVKHADQLVWNEVNGRVDLAAGDLIRSQAETQAVIHFFDDSEVRVGEDSLLLLSQLAVSPVYARQGIIELSLHEGEAWVQTMNVDDGYAGLTFVTRDALFKALNSTFNVRVNLDESTQLAVFSNKISGHTLKADTRETQEAFKLSANEKMQIVSGQNPVMIQTVLSESDKASVWVQSNLQKDQVHLTALRERGLANLRQATGSLPGEMLYPIKHAKERLKLAFNFDQSDLNLQIEIANKRLNEAIVLLESGREQRAMEALMEYQNLARQIAEAGKKEETPTTLTRQIVTPHQKTLIASLPATSSVGMVKEALGQTAELLAEDPVQRENIRLENTVERLRDISVLLDRGNLQEAKETFATHTLTHNNILAILEAVEDDELKKETLAQVLELRGEEADLLKEIAGKLNVWGEDGKGLARMLDEAEKHVLEEADKASTLIAPLLPYELLAQTQPSAMELRVRQFIDKVSIYKTWQGQKNQIERLLKHEAENVSNLDFLLALRSRLDQRGADLINSKILTLEGKARVQKHKAVERKIDRAVRLRE